MFTAVVRRTVALALMLAFGGSLLLPAISARHTTPDAEDRLVGVASDRASTVDVPSGTEGDEHCPVCHWLRAISGASTMARVVATVASASALRPVTPQVLRQGRSEVPALPSRAPPVASVLVCL